MNQHLETILNFIQQSKELSADEKSNLSNSVQKANGELEHKNRELEIEASLERVRARTMAMQKSEELSETAQVLFRQFNDLGAAPIQITIGIFNEEKGVVEFRSTDPLGTGARVDYAVNGSLEEPTLLKKIYADWKGGKKSTVIALSGKALSEWVKYRISMSGVPDNKDYSDARRVVYVGFFSKGMLSVSAMDDPPQESVELLERFAGVFDLTYTRFKDLKNAEAQAREAQIEAGLERVRSRAIAMRKTDELLEAAELVFKELTALGIESMNVSYGFVDKEEKYASFHGVNPVDGKIPPFPVLYPHTETEVMRSILSSWKKQVPFHVIDLDEQATVKHQTFVGGHILKMIIKNNLSIPFSIEAFLEVSPKTAVIYNFNFIKGYLFIIGEERLTTMQEEIVLRFTKVFEQAYIRFLDLQKAEAQAREAQIEAALERVRSKALAMQKAEDLAGAVAIVFDELDKLNLGMLRCGIGILNREKRSADVWTTGISEQGKKVQVSGDESIDIHPLLQGAFDAWLNQHDFSYELKGNDIAEYYTAITKTNFHLPEAQAIAERAKTQPLQQFYYVAPFESGTLFAFRETEFPDEAKKVIKRFAEVFNLTYTRFLDLQKAEAQAKEAQLERKRSEDLLLNILPREIADELKQFGKSYARKHDEVTILFSDIKGFSTISENLSADELVTQLDECFRAFDKIIEKHGLEKIKTVGDAYICACGLPKPVPDNAAKTVRAAIDMLDFLKGFSISKKIQNLPAFEFRIGIHTGPVVTGVVGLKKFTYDIWGDAVNMAARMEQHGEAGRINVSGATYQLIKDKFNCTHRGKIQAKNKGEVDMYFVDSIA